MVELDSTLTTKLLRRFSPNGRWRFGSPPSGVLHHQPLSPMPKFIVITDNGTRYHRSATIACLDEGELALLESGRLDLSSTYPIDSFSTEDLELAHREHLEEEISCLDGRGQRLKLRMDSAVDVVCGGHIVKVSHTPSGVLAEMVSGSESMRCFMGGDGGGDVDE